MRNLDLRLSKAIKKANIFKGQTTINAITEQLPKELLEKLYSTDIAFILEAIDKAYKLGKASAGAEMIDTNAVYINSIGRVIEWNEEGAEFERREFTETSIEGRKSKYTKALKIKDGILVAKFVE